MLRRLLLTTATVVLLLLASGAIALAHDDGGQRIVRPRTFSIAAGQCPRLPAGLSVQGQGIERTTIVVGGDDDAADGDDGDESLFRLTTTIVGSATDSAGGRYTFSYRLRVRSLEGDPTSGIAVDSFRLDGDGAANGLATFFRAAITFDANFNPIGFQILEESGNPRFCDPL